MSAPALPRASGRSVAIQYDRCTQHHACDDFFPAVRERERAGIIGDRPV